MPPRIANKIGARGMMPQSIPANPTVGGLWALVALEVLAIVGLRRYYRKHHGG